MTINDLLKLANADEYDFSDDGAGEAYHELSDPMEKFFVYFASKGKNTIKRETDNFMNDYREDCEKLVKQYGNINDPDSGSDLLQTIYVKLWDERNLKDCKKGERICGETMNSANTTLGAWYTELETEQQKKEREELKNPSQTISNKYILSRYLQDKEGQKKLLGKKCLCFLSLYHTLGNFIPVPVDCNCPRGIGQVADYWDLTLKVIYDYYVGNDHICDITGTSDELVQRYKNWLDSFIEEGDNGLISWDRFVEKNYMQDFVEPDPEGGYGMPKELWKDHFSQFLYGEAKPTNERQVKEFYINASARIMKRSNRMIQELEHREVMMETDDSIIEDAIEFEKKRRDPLFREKMEEEIRIVRENLMEPFEGYENDSFLDWN